MNDRLSVTFDTNVVELVLDEEQARREGVQYQVIHSALQDGRIKGYVSRVYFAHDAITKSSRMDKLCGDIEICIPLSRTNGVEMRFEQMEKVALDGFHARTLEQMARSGVECIDVRRKFWPELEYALPFCRLPHDYDEKASTFRRYIEDDLHCGFAYFREYLRAETECDGDDLAMLLQLKDREYNKKKFEASFAEAGDGDSLISHYACGIDVFCTNDQASHAGERSIFSHVNRRKLADKFGVKIMSVAQLSDCLAKGGSHADLS